MSEPVKIVITLDGGLIQDVASCGVPVDVIVVDLDTDGATAEDGVVRLPLTFGGDRAFITGWGDTPGLHSPEEADKTLLLHQWCSEQLEAAR